MKRSILTMAIMFALWVRPVPAAIVLSLEAAPGVDLSHITVGQELEFQVFASGGQHTEYPISINGDLLDGPAMTAGFELISASSPIGHSAFFLDTPHVLLDFVIRATSPGVASFDADFGATNSGYFLTNLRTYHLATNAVRFDISPAAVPEPSSLLMMGMACAAGLVVRRRRAIA